MEQISKLYKYYLNRIFKKHWLRITIVSLVTTLTFWFGIPYFFYHYDTVTNKKKTYREHSQAYFGDGTLEINTERSRLKLPQEEIKKYIREELNKAIKELKDAKKDNKDEAHLQEIKDKINGYEIFDKGAYSGIDIIPYTSDNVFFFCQTEDYAKEKSFWKLLNNISWWNLTGAIMSFWLIFKVLDSTFSQPQKDGEEVMVLSFTPSVKRSDLFIAKILAFLTFYTLINLLTFILPYGFYYFWVAKTTSFSAFSFLTLYATVVGPILYFGLILTPYLVVSDWTEIGFSIFSSLIVIFPMIWGFGKLLFWKFATWPYTVEEKFFDPTIFTAISLITGVVFILLYYLRYQEKDLGN